VQYRSRIVGAKNAPVPNWIWKTKPAKTESSAPPKAAQPDKTPDKKPDKKPSGGKKQD